MTALDARVWRGRLLVVVPIVVATAVLARAAIHGVLEKVGHPGATLDDSYIHFQYARAIAEGHPLRFQAGEPYTSGATSLLWPLLLAPFYALGMRGEDIMWAAWALSFVALGGLAYEAFELTKRLTGPAIAAGAAAMVLAFAGFAWGAASGMEVVPFAWAMARSARRASEWAELEPVERSRGRAAELVVMAFVVALLRPEGALVAMFVAVTLVLFPRERTLRSRALGLAAVLAALTTPLILWMTTGSPTSNTTIAKLMLGNPYYRGHVLVDHALANARLLVGELLNGEKWSAEFLPPHGAPLAMAGLVAIPIAGYFKGTVWRATSILLLALLMFAPCFYITFLWNRLRYLWPFATGWLIGVACLASIVVLGLTELAKAARGLFHESSAPSDTWTRWVRVAGGAFGALATGFAAWLLFDRVDGTLDDVGWCASGIHRQQVTLGQWAKENLPEDARIGVNDTGAIAYFSDRKTFDVVGLTTDGEARYWAAGAGSRFEHYERLWETSPRKLPTHFIVYPEWMACSAVLGEVLYEASVYDASASILGGQTMRVYKADYALLGSGEAPWTEMGEITDVVDVADLESEAAHKYELLGARDGEEVARDAWSPDGTRRVADGGRMNRARERFVAKLRPGVDARMVVRLEGVGGAPRVRVIANGAGVGSFWVVSTEWREHEVVVPGSVATAETTIELVAEGAFVNVFHYWFDAVTSSALR